MFGLPQMASLFSIIGGTRIFEIGFYLAVEIFASLLILRTGRFQRFHHLTSSIGGRRHAWMLRQLREIGKGHGR